MESFLIYIGKSAIAAGAFYLAFLVLFQNQKHFVFNRIYLPVSMMVSFLIPLIRFTTVKYIEPTNFDLNSFAYLPASTEIVQPGFQPEWYHYLLGFYVFGVAGFLFHLLLGHFRAVQIVHKSRLQQLFESWVNITKKDVHPFSFFRRIVLSEKTLKSENLQMIVCHEKIHVDEKHTFDILFVEILFLFQWFNPFAWLLKDAVKNNLEYKTDHQIAQKFNPQKYQMAMVAMADKKGVAPFLTALNGSQLKNRIIMMKKKTENKFALLKQLLVLPLLAVLVMSLSAREVKTEIKEAPASKNTVLIVDGVEIPLTSEKFSHLNFSKEINGKEIIDALNLDENKVKSSMLIMNEDEGEALKFLIRTTDYVPGTNPEFDELTSTEEQQAKTEKPKKELYAIDGKLIGREEIGKKETYNFESLTVLSGDDAVKKYGETAKDATVMDFKTGESKISVTLTDKKTVSGKVTDKNGDPITGVAIVVKGSTVGTVTDRQGYYRIEIDENTESLVFVMIGFEKQEITVDEKSEIDVQLEPEKSKNTNEIYVVGYADDENSNEPVFTDPEQAPQFPGGNPALKKYIANSIIYPRTALEDGIQGIVYVTFVVNKKGKVVNPKASRQVEPALDKEALRVVGNLPLWKPGKQDGKIVNTSLTVPVEFNIPDSYKKSIKVGLDGKPLNNQFDKTVSGKVTDANGNPLPGATIIVKGTASGTVTDNNGNYVIKTANNSVLVFSMIGFKRAEIMPGDKTEFNITLQKDNSDDPTQIKVIGYGKKPAGNGVLNIRNAQTGEEPIYIVDGIEMKSIELVDPNTIESIDVLKGESAVAKYGEKAKNGAVIITSKKIEKANVAEIPGKPLVVVDGKEFKSIEEANVPPEEIASISVLKDKSATALYGDKGKDGVIVITTNNTAGSAKITTPLELRRFIAGRIKYPVEAQKNDEQGTVFFHVEFGKTNKVVSVNRFAQEDIVQLDEIVVVGYENGESKNQDKEKQYPALVKEAHYVLQQIPEVDIPEFRGKAVGIAIKFVLQD